MSILAQERLAAVVTVIVQMVLLINAFLTAAGKNPIPLDENAISETLTYFVTVAWNVWAWWRNNNVTKAAVEGQKVINTEKGIE